MDDEKVNTNRNNFDLLWQIMDERYCFFEEKGIDWNAVYDEYERELPRIGENSYRLFDLMSGMLLELEDGHVSLSNNSEIRSYNGWYSKYPDNCNEGIINQYLGRRARHLGNGMIFTFLAEEVGYIRCPSFSDKVNRVELDTHLALFSSCKGIIIDVRNNGGGLVSEAYTFASRFARQKTHVGYVRYKTGKGHNDFSSYFSRYVEPEGAHPFYGKVAILTNRRVYSAANLFVSIMKNLPDVCIMGDYTGGGGGIPISAELYNGWTVELSTNPVFDNQKNSIEGGIEPHRKITLTTNNDNEDNIIESAKSWILNN